MNETTRFIIQVSANVFGAGFVVILGSAQFADYFVDYRIRHILAALAWWVLVPILILHTAIISKPPLLPLQLVNDWVSIGWLLCLLLGVAWGVLRMWEKRQEIQARKRLKLDEVKEKP